MDMTFSIAPPAGQAAEPSEPTPTPAPTHEDRAALRLQSALLASATGLTKDPVEAQALVALTLAKADSARASQVQLYRMLRETYHSIERSRSRRPARDAVVTAMAAANKSATLPTA
jgi:hypothetical protein